MAYMSQNEITSSNSYYGINSKLVVRVIFLLCKLTKQGMLSFSNLFLNAKTFWLQSCGDASGVY